MTKPYLFFLSDTAEASREHMLGLESMNKGHYPTAQRHFKNALKDYETLEQKEKATEVRQYLTKVNKEVEKSYDTRGSYVSSTSSSSYSNDITTASPSVSSYSM